MMPASVSDIAAMAAVPKAALISVSARAEESLELLLEVYKGWRLRRLDSAST